MTATEKSLTILIVDDTDENLALIGKFLTKLGHRPIAARNGAEAIALFQSECPDLILMDVMMPVMDGYEATARIKALAGKNWVPVIFLSAKAQDTDQAKGLQADGDDYLTKPVNLLILAEKIHAMQRIAVMQRKLVAYATQLEQNSEENENEQRLAKYLLDKIIRLDKIDTAYIKQWILPAHHFSGDVIVAARTPGDTIHVILADGTGHGLSAAINVMPVIEAFYGMTEKGFSIPSIVRELNRKIKMLMPTERFVAATLASIDMSSRTIHVWNGGGPDAFFLSADGKILRNWKSLHPALGILGDDLFDNRTEPYQWPEGGQFFMCSDGLLEAENEDTEAFGAERMRDTLVSVPQRDRFAALVKAVNQHMGWRSGHDDVSLVAVDCLMDYESEIASRRSASHKLGLLPQQSRWKLALTLSAAELKTFDVLPLIIGWLDQLKLSHEHRSQIFLVLAELFNNALDHGILNLDSHLKAEVDGFEKYMEQRTARLIDLNSGLIEIGFERVRHAGGEYLQLRVKDSGNGFNYRPWIDTNFPDNTSPAGRGIMLIRNLCARLEYLGNGNEAVVLYQLS